MLTDSTDINPQSSFSEYNHGTSCAGEIAMIHNNGICGAGVAYGSTIAGMQSCKPTMHVEYFVVFLICDLI